MGLKSFFGTLYARVVKQQNKWWIENPIKSQEKVFASLISQASETDFGKEHDFKNIRSYEDFKSRVPVRDYEDLKIYIERTLEGEENILWPGRPLYFCMNGHQTWECYICREC